MIGSCSIWHLVFAANHIVDHSGVHRHTLLSDMTLQTNGRQSRTTSMAQREVDTPTGNFRGGSYVLLSEKKPKKIIV